MPSARCSAGMRMALIATSQSASASVMLGRRCWISRVMEHVDSFGFGVGEGLQRIATRRLEFRHECVADLPRRSV